MALVPADNVVADADGLGLKTGAEAENTTFPPETCSWVEEMV